MTRSAAEIIQQVTDEDDDVSVYQQQRTLFLITHMRSYSTLLSQILGSNPEINGFIESRRSYQDIKDIVELRKDVRYAQDTPLEDGYVLDKLIHNNQTISTQLQQRDDITMLIMIRKPLDCINSLYQTSSKYGWGVNLDNSINYYVNRLKGIREFVEKYGRQPLYLDAESLIDNTAATLDWLSRLLKLQHPLSENFKYQSFRARGKMQSGDPSDYIQKEKIIRQRTPRTVEITPDNQELLEQTYTDVRTALLASCMHMY